MQTPEEALSVIISKIPSCRSVVQMKKKKLSNRKVSVTREICCLQLEDMKLNELSIYLSNPCQVS